MARRPADMQVHFSDTAFGCRASQAAEKAQAWQSIESTVAHRAQAGRAIKVAAVQNIPGLRKLEHSSLQRLARLTGQVQRLLCRCSRLCAMPPTHAERAHRCRAGYKQLFTGKAARSVRGWQGCCAHLSSLTVKVLPSRSVPWCLLIASWAASLVSKSSVP